MFYIILLGCMMVAFVSIWNSRRLLLLPVVYFGPYTFFRWAGKHYPQWGSVYYSALTKRTVFLAGSDPRKPDPAAPRKAIFDLPRFNA